MDFFNEKLGFYPSFHINHYSNLDNIYWGYERFQFILGNIFRIIYRDKRKFYGSDMKSEYFWGDICKSKIKYIKNYTFNDINTLKIDPLMPYIDKTKRNMAITGLVLLMGIQ